jgi:hypothetical protein
MPTGHGGTDDEKPLEPFASSRPWWTRPAWMVVEKLGIEVYSHAEDVPTATPG